ncbi:hypothetical protein RB195_023959 [Necator americanus]|uniref:Uncharacterized protein n=1 Tax=Necator americanus TaxID=51031 RepID=A0ABR1ELC7_NECAM
MANAVADGVDALNQDIGCDTSPSKTQTNLPMRNPIDEKTEVVSAIHCCGTTIRVKSLPTSNILSATSKTVCTSETMQLPEYSDNSVAIK